MCGSRSLCYARTSCASSLVAVVIFFPLLSCTVTALILICGFFACSPDSPGLVAACCWVVSSLLLLALPSCIWSSSDLLVVDGLLTGVGEVPSLIVVWVVDVSSPPVVCFFVSSVLAFFACASSVDAGSCHHVVVYRPGCRNSCPVLRRNLAMLVGCLCLLCLFCTCLWCWQWW